MQPGYPTVPTELTKSRPNSVEHSHSTMVDAYHAGLAADLDSLLAIFDGIEKMVAADGRAKALCPSLRSRSIRALVQ
jgi:hypothetical protein